MKNIQFLTTDGRLLAFEIGNNTTFVEEFVDLSQKYQIRFCHSPHEREFYDPSSPKAYDFQESVLDL